MNQLSHRTHERAQTFAMQDTDLTQAFANCHLHFADTLTVLFPLDPKRGPLHMHRTSLLFGIKTEHNAISDLFANSHCTSSERSCDPVKRRKWATKTPRRPSRLRRMALHVLRKLSTRRVISYTTELSSKERLSDDKKLKTLPLTDETRSLTVKLET